MNPSGDRRPDLLRPVPGELASGALIVRDARAEDLDAITRIAGGVLEGAWTRVSLGEELRRPIGRCSVAEDPRSGAVVGFAIVWHVADEASLLLIAVDAAVQRGGVGSRLLAALEARARSEGMVVVHLEVRRGNAAARAFYVRSGYTELGVRRGYYEDGEDAILMSHDLVEASR